MEVGAQAAVMLDASRTQEQVKRSGDEDKVKVAREFEAIFVRQLLDQMQVQSNDGMGAEMYQGMSNEALAEHITTHSEGFGIAHSLLKHWGVKQV